MQRIAKLWIWLTASALNTGWMYVHRHTKRKSNVLRDLLSKSFIFSISVFGSLMLASSSVVGQTFECVKMYHPDWNIPTYAAEVRYLSVMNIKQVFLSVYAPYIDIESGEYYNDYTARLADFIKLAKNHGISAHAMTLDSDESHLCFTDNHEAALGKIRNILAYCSNHPSAAFDGIHIDLEPHTLNDWRDVDGDGVEPDPWSKEGVPEARNAIMRQYVELLMKIRTEIDNEIPWLYLSASIDYWYNDRADQGLLRPWGNATLLGWILDFLVPMDYLEEDDFPKPDEEGKRPVPTLDDKLPKYIELITERVEDEILEAPTMVGIKAMNFTTHSLAKRPEDLEMLEKYPRENRTVYSNILDVMAAIESKFRSKRNYRGICIFKHSTLKKLRKMYMEERVLCGFGKATVDGFMDPEEWGDADTVRFRTEPLPPEECGDVVPSTLFVMNDETNLYLAVKVMQNMIGSEFFFWFDNNNDGWPEVGDDVLRFSTRDEAGWWRFDCYRDGPEPFAFARDEWALSDGKNDGQVAARNDGTFSFYEISHPLDSDDDAHDFSLTAGDTVGYCLSLWSENYSSWGVPRPRLVNILVPGTGNYGKIMIALMATAIAKPVDATTGTTPIAVVFSCVGSSGNTSLKTNSSGPPPPSGFKPGVPPIYYELTTTASCSGSIEVCINYSGVSFADETKLKLFHFEDTDGDGIENEWVDRTVSVDTNSKEIWAEVASLSLFAIFEPLNIPPVADAGPDQAVLVYEDTQFDGSGSRDPDGTIVSYQWDFGDGTPTESGVSVTHAYAASGTYTVTLTVKDDYDAEVTDAATVTAITAVEAVSDLITTVQGMKLHHGIENSLVTRLEAAKQKLEREQQGAAINKLNAFINEVEAQRYKKLTEEQVDELIAYANRIVSVLNVALTPALAIPEEPELAQNYPNPFNPDTWIPYQLAGDADVTIRIYDAAGRLVRALELGYRPAGFYRGKEKAAYWDGTNEAGEPVASGIYFYTIQAGEFTATKKMVVAK